MVGNIRICAPSEKLFELIANIVEDEGFRRRFEENPREMLAEYGIEIPHDAVPKSVKFTDEHLALMRKEVGPDIVALWVAPFVRVASKPLVWVATKSRVSPGVRTKVTTLPTIETRTSTSPGIQTTTSTGVAVRVGSRTTTAPKVKVGTKPGVSVAVEVVSAVAMTGEREREATNEWYEAIGVAEDKALMAYLLTGSEAAFLEMLTEGDPEVFWDQLGSEDVEKLAKHLGIEDEPLIRRYFETTKPDDLLEKKLAEAETKEPADLLDINVATEAQLMELPNIGKSKAARIFKARPIRSWNHLQRILRIGEDGVRQLSALARIGTGERGSKHTRK